MKTTSLEYRVHPYPITAVVVMAAGVIAVASLALALVSPWHCVGGTAGLGLLAAWAIAYVSRKRISLSRDAVTLFTGFSVQRIPYATIIRSTAELAANGETLRLNIERTSGSPVTLSFWWFSKRARQTVLSRPEFRIEYPPGREPAD